MKKQTLISKDHKNLIRRYLLWAYKSTKESFERIERKTTQLIVDEYILKQLSQHKCEIPLSFKTYIEDKRKDELTLKFLDGKKEKSHPDYVYLKNRLMAIESAIKYFLGEKELKRMHQLFEVEFTSRILESREH